RAERRQELVARAVDVDVVGDVAGIRFCSRADRARLVARSLEARARPPEEGEGHAAPREREGRRSADAAARPRDDGDARGHGVAAGGALHIDTARSRISRRNTPFNASVSTTLEVWRSPREMKQVWTSWSRQNAPSASSP